MMLKNSHKGFTIIELIVSVFIIVLLTGIVISSLSDSKQKSRDAKRVSDIAQLQLALELYFDRCNQYPALGANNLMNVDASNGCPTLSDGTQIKLSTFLSKIPTPPTPGDYYYGLIGSYTAPTDYVLRARLEKPNQATLDDIDGSFSNVYYGAPGNPPFQGGFGCDDSTTTSYFCVQPR